MKGEYELSSQHCLQAATLLECHTQCKQLLATQTMEQGQSAAVGGEATTTSDSTSCIRKIVYDTSFDDDSFLDQMANLDIHTSPSLPQDGSTIIKGASPPSLPSMELHPGACMCQVCTNPQSALHTARLVVQCSNIALMQIRDGLEKDSNVDLARVRLVADVLVSLREVVSKRIEKCDKALETVNTAGGVEKRNETGGESGGGGGKERKISKKSSRSAGHRTNKSIKSPSISSSKTDRRSVAESADFQRVLASVAVARSESFIILEQPKEAVEELESALSQAQLRQGDYNDICVDKELGVARAWLHYQMGVACVQEVELSRPELSARLYEERGDETKQLVEDDTVATTTSRSKRSKTAKKTVTTSSSSVTTRPRRTRKTAAVKSNHSASSRQGARENPFSLALNHFLSCYQLCFPSLPAILTREVSQWVGLLVRGQSGEGGGAEIAAHFVNTGINCTLMHQTIYCIGKKMR